MVAGKHALPGCRGEDGALEKLSKLADGIAATPRARSHKNCRSLARRNLLLRIFYCGSRNSERRFYLICNFGRTCADRGQKEIVGDLYECRPRQRTAQYVDGFGNGCGEFVRAGHTAGEARERPDDFQLLGSLMQRSAGPGEKR